MRLLNLISLKWAVIPAVYSGIRTHIESHVKGEKLNLKEMESRILADDSQPHETMRISGDTAIIYISGLLMKNAGLFERIILGAVSMNDIRDRIEEALKNDGIKRIILSVDSPGGTVDGTQELADFIYESRNQKEIIAVADGTLASAAYWIASAASKVYITNETTQTGSIGVVTSHFDHSGLDKNVGIVETEIYAGKYKRIASGTQPLSTEGREYMQGMVDYLYSVFVNSIAKYRGVSPEEAISKMADGRIFIGRQAIDAGLVDGISTFDGIVNNKLSYNSEFESGIDSKNNKGVTMNLSVEALQKDFPEIYKAVFDSGKAEAEKNMQAAISTAKAEGIKAEQERIKGVYAQMRIGYDDIITAKMFDGISNAGDAAIAINQKEKEVHDKALKAMEDSAPKPLADGGVDPMGDVNKGNKNLDPKAEWDKNEELRAEFGDNFKAYEAFIKASASGKVKVLRRV